MNELAKEYYELRSDASLVVGAVMANSDVDLSDPMQLKAITMLKKCLDFSDKMFEAQIDMMKKIDKIYEDLTTKK